MREYYGEEIKTDYTRWANIGIEKINEATSNPYISAIIDASTNYVLYEKASDANKARRFRLAIATVVGYIEEQRIKKENSSHGIF